jgi:hypothetical protein
VGRTPGDIERELGELASVDRQFGDRAIADAQRLSPSPDGPYEFPATCPFDPDFPSFAVPTARERMRQRVKRALRTKGTSVRKVAGMTAFVPSRCILSADIERLLGESPQCAEADLVYGDSVHYLLNKAGDATFQLRPGWSPERLRAHCYLGHVVLASDQLVEAAGGTRFLKKLKPHDRALRLAEHATRVERIAGFVYASVGGAAHPAADLEAVRGHCLRTGIRAECTMRSQADVVEVSRVIEGSPRVAVIIPTRGTTSEVHGRQRVLVVEAIRSLVRQSSLARLEFVVVADRETPADVLTALNGIEGIVLTVVSYDKPFNFAEKINIGSLHTDADYLLLMNDDTEVLDAGTVDRMLAYFPDESVGQVGPILLFEDGSVQSAGHLLNPAPFDLYRGYPPYLRGGNDILHVAREVSSVIAAFSLVRTNLFRQVGGLSIEFPRDYNDVDFALKLRAIGRKTVLTPYVRCLHLESKTRVAVPESDAVNLLGRRWRHVIENDPYGNPWLQRHEFVWKAAVPSGPALNDAFGCEAQWDGGEWAALNEREDRHLHRTMYFPKWMRLRR